jgi:hypothetical protein
MDTPTDLVPLPTMPYDERPDSLPLDIEECRTALWLQGGNVSEAAKLLKISSLRLRNFIKTSKRLSDEQREMQEVLLDKAESVAAQALDDEDTARKDTMARFIMTNLGKDRGYGTPNGKGGVNVNLPTKGRMVIAWDDGSEITGPAMNTIEGEKVA